MPTDRPYTDAELEAGASALREVRHVIASDGYPAIVLGTDEQDAATVLRAVLPDHDARVRAEECAQVVDEIARDFHSRCRCTTPDPPCNAELLAAHVRGSHATTLTTEEDPHRG